MIRAEGQWRRAIPGEWIHSNEIHVWRTFLDVTTDQMQSLSAILSADEVERAGKFRFERDQKRFIAAHGMLRQILGRYVGKDPHHLRFDHTSYGKPMLAPDSGDDTLRFNLSHSGAYALYGVTRGRNIGIDIERVRDDVDVAQMAQRFFSQDEINSLENIDKNMRTEAFFQYWTRKEAFLKAMGKGVSFPMEKCDVSLLNGSVWSPITLIDDHKESSCWYGQDLNPGGGYVAAIALEGLDGEISYWDYVDGF